MYEPQPMMTSVVVLGLGTKWMWLKSRKICNIFSLGYNLFGFDYGGLDWVVWVLGECIKILGWGDMGLDRLDGGLG